MKKLVYIKYLFVCVLLVVGALTSQAQRRMHVRSHSLNTQWDAPYIVTDIDSVTLSDDGSKMVCHVSSGMSFPINVEDIDSLTFEDEPTVETKDYYKVFPLYIYTADGQPITSKTDYSQCYLSFNALGSFSNFSASASMRGRGNSSWLWYDKKPYRIKLDEKHKVLGLGKSKTWVLLANYRDVTDLMNAFVFETAEWLGMPFTNHTRYVELFLNGEYLGLYQLTEQVQQGKNRVEIADDGGILLSLDVDDGPSESPDATDNFWSSVFQMPTCVKYPEDDVLTADKLQEVKDSFAILEQAIKDKDYSRAEALMDMKSFMHYLMIQELVENVELVAPRSIYLYKDKGGKWTFGPMWDFDAGYDFDWSNMETGHNYFSDYKELVMGTNPVARNGYDSNIPAFFTNLFGCADFVEAYKNEWNNIKDSIVARNWAEMEKYLNYIRQGASVREMNQWPIWGKTYDKEVSNLHNWLSNRAEYLTSVINAYPVPTDSEKFCGTMSTSVTLSRSRGYSQTVKISISKTELQQLLAVNDFAESNIRNIIPLNSDGTDGENHTSGTYGGWFDAEGDPGYWEFGHAYIEVYNNLFNWSCGIHPSNCISDSSHVVTMQIQYADGSVLKKVNVTVTMNIK